MNSELRKGEFTNVVFADTYMSTVLLTHGVSRHGYGVTLSLQSLSSMLLEGDRNP
jgi:hypothetical protein